MNPGFNTHAPAAPLQHPIFIELELTARVLPYPCAYQSAFQAETPLQLPLCRENLTIKTLYHLVTWECPIRQYLQDHLPLSHSTATWSSSIF